MELNWLIDGFRFYFLDTTFGFVGLITVYVFAKLALEYRRN